MIKMRLLASHAYLGCSSRVGAPMVVLTFKTAATVVALAIFLRMMNLG